MIEQELKAERTAFRDAMQQSIMHEVKPDQHNSKFFSQKKK